jgi:bifunctional non-homologous end joining protein LigD
MSDGGDAPDPLGRYRSMRSADRTPEPVPAPGGAGEPAADGEPVFVIQQHRATALHWDLRLERDGVLASWAVPKGLPPDPGRNHMAIRTEDHPMEYADFTGDIPAGEYGGGGSAGGRVTLYDRGTYELEKWTEREVKFVLHGTVAGPETPPGTVRAEGRYVLFRTKDRGGDRRESWMIHRMDPTPPGWAPLPERIAPMLAVPGPLPEQPDGWAYEMKWDGVRLVLYVAGGRVRAMTRNERDVTSSYPELRAIGADLGTRQAVLDGEVVALDETGRVSFGALQPRMHVARPTAKLLNQTPVTFLAFDLLHLDGASTLDLSYSDRRTLLTDLDLSAPYIRVPPHFSGDGAAALETSKAQRLEGVVAKRLDSRYTPGKRSGAWIKVKNVRTQEVVVGGWREGGGKRAGRIGSLLVGIPSPGGLRYAGHVGTGFSEAVLDDLTARMRASEQTTSPFDGPLPRIHAKGARWVAPDLVGEVAFGEWTDDGVMRHPSWRGLRIDKDPADVQVEG